MPNWEQVLIEIQKSAEKNHPNVAIDLTRKKYIQELSSYTKRDVIVYYSGWMQNTFNSSAFQINDDDRNGFMQMLHGLKREDGLDLILHTPGGSISATEAIINYLMEMYNYDDQAGNIRVIVPHTCMSGGTIIALSSSEIIMAKHSSIGPIDPQMNGIGATSVITEFRHIYKAIMENRESILLWQPILNKYSPTQITECLRAIEWAKRLANQYLREGMKIKNKRKINKIVKGLIDINYTNNHSQQISKKGASDLGLNVTALEDDPELQDLVLTIHHCCTHTFTHTNVIKIMENSLKSSYLIIGSPQQ